MKIQLSRAQFFLILFIVQTGFVFTSFQNLLISQGKRDSTWLFLIVAILFFLLLLFYERTYHYFQFNGFTKVLYLVYWFFYIVIFVSYMTYVLTTWIFISTPNSIIIFSLLAVCFYASISRPETAVNIGVILLPLLFLFFFFIFLAIPDLEISKLFPLFKESPSNWMKGILYATYAFNGAEVYLVLRKYVLKDENLNKKSILIYVSVLTAFNFISLLFILMFFTIEEIGLIPQPILYLLNSQEVTFVKRLDIFFIYIWLCCCIVAIINYVLVMRLVFYKEKSDRRRQVLQQFVFFVSVGVVSIFLAKLSVIEFLKHNLVLVNIAFGIALPLIIIGVNKLRRRSPSDTSI